MVAAGPKEACSREICGTEWGTQIKTSGQAIEKDGCNAMEQAELDQGTMLRGGQDIVVCRP